MIDSACAFPFPIDVKSFKQLIAIVFYINQKLMKIISGYGSSLDYPHEGNSNLIVFVVSGFISY